ncbi:MAG: hypothetical protein AB1609_16695 [Bacillota bacterium]
MGPLSLEPHAAGQLMFDLGVAEEEEGHREGAPPFASTADRAGPGDTAPAASSAAARASTRGYRQVKLRPEDEWTPEHVHSYLSGLGLHPDNLVVGPDMLKELPFGGVRRVDWAEGARRACFPLRFLPRWRWGPYFVTALGQEGLILGRPWVALAREPSGLRPYWLSNPYHPPRSGETDEPILPACFTIGNPRQDAFGGRRCGCLRRDG